MTFSVAAPATPKAAEPATPAPPAKSVVDSADKQQVGARVTKAVYRELKARAALTGETVQTLVERAIVEFLNKATR